MRDCHYCGHPIDPERLECLPKTKTCVKCSDVRMPMALMDYGHKTAPSLVIVGDDSEQRRLALRAFRRAR
jgi:hypothetical protein